MKAAEEETTMPQAATEHGMFADANLRFPTQSLTAEGRAASEAVKEQEAAAAKEPEDAFANGGQMTRNLFGSVDSSDDEIQQRRTADNAVVKPKTKRRRADSGCSK